MDHNNSPKRGRPRLGLEAKDVIYKVRVDAFTHRRIGRSSRLFGLTKTELVRQAILFYLEHLETAYPEVKLH